MKKLIIFFLFIGQISIAQNVSVLKTEKILSSVDAEYFFPNISSDGSKILLSKQNFVGLYLFDIFANKTVQLSEKQGAGYKPVFNDDASIVFFKENEYDGMRKISAICSVNTKDKKKKIIEGKKRNVSNVQFVDNQLFYTVDNKVKKISSVKKTSNKNDIFVCIERQKIALYNKGVKNILYPKGEGNYVWASLSPDKTKILFTFTGRGTYISDLKGNILSDLGYLNAPKWYNNDWVLGMKDYDNGIVQTASDIYIVSGNGEKTFQLTKTKNKIEMYPDCSAESSKIVYHTATGDIYLLTIKIN